MDISGILTELHDQRDRINQAIAALESLNGAGVSRPAVVSSAKTAPAAPPSAKKRVISPEARRRMAEAQQKRWAKAKRAANVAVKKTPTPVKVTVKQTTPKKVGGGITAAGRKALSEAAKARWAKRKRAVKRAAKKAAAPVATTAVKEAPEA